MTSDDRPGARRRPWSARPGVPGSARGVDPTAPPTGPAAFILGRGSTPSGGPQSASHADEPVPGARADAGPATGTDRSTPARHPSGTTAAGRPGPAGGPSHHRPAREPRGLGRALGLTALGTVLPGTGLVAAGRRRLGWTVFAVFLLALALGAYLVLAGQRAVLLRVAVDSTALLVLGAGVALAALAWVGVVVLSYRSLRPRRLRGWQRALGGLVVAVLCAAVVVPAVTAVRLAAAQRDLVDTVFADRESATVVDAKDEADPFGGRESINVLLLGGDGGAGREGVRTDTVIVAHVEVATGRTTLFSLPRNLEDLPFPADSPLAALYPEGFDAGSESESLLNAVYRNGPAAHPDVLGPTADPGADFLKLGVGEALGLDIDYHVLVNLEGFARLVDALGGITVNVNYYVPINGEPSRGILPDDYIAPGPDQQMDGTRALDFARGRFGLTDYQRMDRQRCVLDAIVQAADPVTLLSSYRELAATTQDIVSTDVPSNVLGDVVDLALRVKDSEIRSVVFDNTVIDPAYPDYDRMRALVQEALAAPAPVDDADDAAPSGTPSPGTSPAPSPEPAPTDGAGVASEVGDACAYDPVAAAEAIAAGKPPIRGG